MVWASELGRLREGWLGAIKLDDGSFIEKDTSTLVCPSAVPLPLVLLFNSAVHIAQVQNTIPGQNLKIRPAPVHTSMCLYIYIQIYSIKYF